MSFLDRINQTFHSTLVSAENSIQETFHDAVSNASETIDSFSHNLNSLAGEYRYFYSGVWREGASSGQRIVGNILGATTIAGAAAGVGLAVYAAAITAVGAGVLKGLTYGGAVLIAGVGLSGCGPVTGDVIQFMTHGGLRMLFPGNAGYSSGGTSNQISTQANEPRVNNASSSPVVSAESPTHTASVVHIQNNIIVTNQPIEFDFDSYEMRPNFYLILDEVSDYIRQHPEIRRVAIIAHADGSPIDYNLRLASHRALAVRNYLMSRGDNCTYEAMGTVANGSAIDATQSRSRRVEFIIPTQQ